MMETKLFFSILLSLVLIGTFVSLMNPGSSMPSTIGITNMSVNTTSIAAAGSGGVCEPSPWNLWCTLSGFTDWGAGVVKAIQTALAFIYNGLAFMVTLTLFLTGITALLGLNGAPLIPEPFNLIFVIGLVFMWLLLIFEFVSRVIGIIWGR